jgi:hypothetical protein
MISAAAPRRGPEAGYQRDLSLYHPMLIVPVFTGSVREWFSSKKNFRIDPGG